MKSAADLWDQYRSVEPMGPADIRALRDEVRAQLHEITNSGLPERRHRGNLLPMLLFYDRDANAAGEADIPTEILELLQAERVLAAMLEYLVRHGGKVPSFAELVEQEKPAAQLHRQRTLQIRDALLTNPPEDLDLFSTTGFLEWAGGVIGRGYNTAREALDRTGCFVTGTPGKTAEGLDRTLANIREYQ